MSKQFKIANLKKYQIYGVGLLVIAGILYLKFHSINQNREVDNPISPTVNDNVAVGLNYRYIRERTVTAKIIQLLTSTPYLKQYSVYKDDFEKQIDILVEEGVYFATLDEIIEFHRTNSFPDKCVWLLFDDGDQSIYDFAYPILEERNIPFTVFIIAGQVGNNNFNNLELMDWDELREMQESGLVSYGSHSYDMHRKVGDQAIFFDPKMHDAFLEDLILSKEVLEEELGQSVTTFMYPFGETNDDLVEIVREAGFDVSFILGPNPIEYKSEIERIPCYLLNNTNFYETIVPWLQKEEP